MQVKEVDLSILLFDNIRCFFSHCVYSACQVATYLKRDDRSINHTNVLRAVNFEIGVDNATFLSRKHAGCTDRMEV